MVINPNIFLILSLYSHQAMLYAAVEQAPSSEVTEADVITRYYARFDEQFFRVCDKELAKINTFFSGLYIRWPILIYIM